MRYLTPVIFLLVLPLSFAVLGPVATILSKITGDPDICHKVARIWSGIVLFLSGIRIEVEGQENVPMDTPVIFACNHASQVDILVLYQALPVPFRFVVKEELFRIPVLGFSMRAAGYIPIDRSGGKKAVKSLQRAAKQIKEGASIVIFPEGTRTRNGRLQEFKAGAFMLAMKSGCPILPVAISGTFSILPKGSIWARPGRIKVRIGTPIQIKQDGRRLKKEEAAMQTRHQIAKMLGEKA